MSETYSIACKDCKEHIWIAQGSYSDLKLGHLYISQKNFSKNVFTWLINHKNHNLIFSPNCNEPICDYKEINIEE